MVTILSPAWFRLVPAACTMVNCRSGNIVSTMLLLEAANRPLGQPACKQVTGKVAFTLWPPAEVLWCNRGKSMLLQLLEAAIRKGHDQQTERKEYLGDQSRPEA